MYTCYVLTCASFFVALFLLVILIFFLPSLPDAGPHLKSLSSGTNSGRCCESVSYRKKNIRMNKQRLSTHMTSQSFLNSFITRLFAQFVNSSKSEF